MPTEVESYKLETRTDREHQFQMLLLRAFGKTVEGAMFSARQHEGRSIGAMAVDSIAGFRTAEALALPYHYVNE